MKSLTAYFCQYCDRLSCYLTKTYRARAYLVGFQEYTSRGPTLYEKDRHLSMRDERIRRNTCHNFLRKTLNSVTSQKCRVLVYTFRGLCMECLGP